jgi:hypothetical protein
LFYPFLAMDARSLAASIEDALKSTRTIQIAISSWHNAPVDMLEIANQAQSFNAILRMFTDDFPKTMIFQEHLRRAQNILQQILGLLIVHGHRSGTLNSSWLVPSRMSWTSSRALLRELCSVLNRLVLDFGILLNFENL